MKINFKHILYGGFMGMLISLYPSYSVTQNFVDKDVFSIYLTNKSGASVRVKSLGGYVNFLKSGDVIPVHAGTQTKTIEVKKDAHIKLTIDGIDYLIIIKKKTGFPSEITLKKPSFLTNAVTAKNVDISVNSYK